MQTGFFLGKFLNKDLNKEGRNRLKIYVQVWIQIQVGVSWFVGFIFFFEGERILSSLRTVDVRLYNGVENVIEILVFVDFFPD